MITIVPTYIYIYIASNWNTGMTETTRTTSRYDTHCSSQLAHQGGADKPTSPVPSPYSGPAPIRVGWPDPIHAWFCASGLIYIYYYFFNQPARDCISQPSLQLFLSFIFLTLVKLWPMDCEHKSCSTSRSVACLRLPLCSCSWLHACGTGKCLDSLDMKNFRRWWRHSIEVTWISGLLYGAELLQYLLPFRL